MYSELDTLSPVCLYTLGNLDGKKICNKILLTLFINSLSNCFRNMKQGKQIGKVVQVFPRMDTSGNN